MKKNIVIVIVLVSGLLSGIGIGSSIVTLMGIMPINDKYNELFGEYNDLAQDYDDLLDDYNTLLTNHSNLFSDYEVLQDAFEEPLTSYVIPTWIEVYEWLYLDDTNSFTYINNTWMSGDFSAMLMTRAKAMNWRMRIVIMTFSHSGDLGWEMYSPIGEHEYVFNFIYVHDTDDPDSLLDVYYIEPMSDNTWVIMDGFNNYIHYNTYWKYSLGISSDTHWINHYTYFA